MNEQDLEIALDAFMAYRPSQRVVTCDFGDQQRDILRQQLAAAFASVSGAYRSPSPSAQDERLALAAHMLMKWFEKSGSGISVRWERIPPVERGAIIKAFREAMRAPRPASKPDRQPESAHDGPLDRGVPPIDNILRRLRSLNPAGLPEEVTELLLDCMWTFVYQKRDAAAAHSQHAETPASAADTRIKLLEETLRAVDREYVLGDAMKRQVDAVLLDPNQAAEAKP